MYKQMGEVVIKILQVSVVTQTVLIGLSPSCKFSMVYMCQKLWKLVGSRQNCKNKQAYFLAHPVVENTYEWVAGYDDCLVGVTDGFLLC